jgi:hypothetical protein
VNLVGDAGKGLLDPAFDQGDREMGYVDPYPLALELLRRVHGRAAAAKWIENNVVFIR